MTTPGPRKQEVGKLVVVVARATLTDANPHKLAPYCEYSLSNSTGGSTDIDSAAAQHHEAVWDHEGRLTVFELVQTDTTPSPILRIIVKRKRTDSSSSSAEQDSIVGEGSVYVQTKGKWQQSEADENRYDFDDYVTIKKNGNFQGEVYLEMTYYKALMGPTPLHRRPSRFEPKHHAERAHKFPQIADNASGRFVPRPRPHISQIGPPAATNPPQAINSSSTTAQAFRIPEQHQQKPATVHQSAISGLLPLPGDPERLPIPDLLRPGRHPSPLGPSGETLLQDPRIHTPEVGPASTLPQSPAPARFQRATAEEQKLVAPEATPLSRPPTQPSPVIQIHSDSHVPQANSKLAAPPTQQRAYSSPISPVPATTPAVIAAQHSVVQRPIPPEHAPSGSVYSGRSEHQAIDPSATSESWPAPITGPAFVEAPRSYSNSPVPSQQGSRHVSTSSMDLNGLNTGRTGSPLEPCSAMPGHLPVHTPVPAHSSPAPFGYAQHLETPRAPFMAPEGRAWTAPSVPAVTGVLSQLQLDDQDLNAHHSTHNQAWKHQSVAARPGPPAERQEETARPSTPPTPPRLRPATPPRPVSASTVPSQSTSVMMTAGSSTGTGDQERSKVNHARSAYAQVEADADLPPYSVESPRYASNVGSSSSNESKVGSGPRSLGELEHRQQQSHPEYEKLLRQERERQMQAAREREERDLEVARQLQAEHEERVALERVAKEEQDRLQVEALMREEQERQRERERLDEEMAMKMQQDQELRDRLDRLEREEKDRQELARLIESEERAKREEERRDEEVARSLEVEEERQRAERLQADEARARRLQEA
ncbi:hypothetical protein OIV83_001358 [Microbotryomycetes sp. JL201]|nr:hypothetical protein OIV83_001358 [Microbotryomycetes sp. JL201]